MSVQAELRKLIRDTLLADASVTALVNGVWDRAPDEAERFAAPKLAYIRFGPSDGVDAGAECIDGEEITIQLDCWSRSVGAIGCSRIVDAVRKALHDKDLQLSANALVEMQVTLWRIMDDPDGLTTHGVVQVTALVEEPE